MARFSPTSGVATGLIDLVLVTIFAVIGRSSHHEGLSFVGVLVTLWPFAIGAASGWLTAYALRVRVGSIGGGVLTVLLTVVIGMLLRVLSGQGVQGSFVIVASLILSVLLIGWRVVGTIVVRRRRGGAGQA